MKTLLVSEVFPPQTGGSGRWFWEIYRRLPQEQFVIAAGEDPRQGEFDAEHDLDVVRLPLQMKEWGLLSPAGARGYWGILRRLNQLARDRAVTHVHCGRCLPEGVAALALKKWRGTPYTTYVHGEDVNTAKNSREFAFLVYRVLRGAERCIANSQNTARLLAEDWNVPADRIRVLHPGVDTARFQPAGRCRQTRRRLGWDDRPVILTVGRLQRRKGQDMMIRALPAIRERVPDVLYCIVGDGKIRGELAEIAERAGVADNVQFLGEATDAELIECYQQCDVFALPNREIEGDIEGFGMVLVEAQACGRPVIAGDSGGTAETMAVGSSGLIADCTAAEPLAQIVLQLLNDRAMREAMGEAARDWVVRRFEWKALALEAAELFGLPSPLPTAASLAAAT